MQTFIKAEYIPIKWMFKWLTDMLYKRKIGHDIMKVFYMMVADWRRENENSTGSVL